MVRGIPQLVTFDRPPITVQTPFEKARQVSFVLPTEGNTMTTTAATAAKTATPAVAKSTAPVAAKTAATKSAATATQAAPVAHG